MKREIILASQSPRRKELLAKCGAAFAVEAADIDESFNHDNDLKQEIMNLSCRKAKAILDKHPDALVIGSDTIVVLDNEVLGKPKDHHDAERMLRELSGRTHQVITGLCLLSADACVKDVSVSDVTFAELSEQEIHDYVVSGEADDKAGSYGIQGKAACFITGIKGDYYSIMGLPVRKVYEALKRLGEL